MITGQECKRTGYVPPFADVVFRLPVRVLHLKQGPYATWGKICDLSSRIGPFLCISHNASLSLEGQE
jgi:hypothetical protein